MKLTVYFDGNFWFALVEHINSKGYYKAFRYPFGKEPKDADIWEFITKSLPALIQKYDNIPTDSAVEKPTAATKMNPKRMQRVLNKAKKRPALSTKAQTEMQKLQQELKTRKKAKAKAKRQTLRNYKYQIKKAKRHQKKQGH